MSVKVKICGITNVEDMRVAVEAGADMIGLIFAESPRKVSAEAAAAIVGQLPDNVIAVGVFVDEGTRVIADICRQTGITHAQLSGGESSDDVAALKNGGLTVIKAIHVSSDGNVAESGIGEADYVLLDTGGRGKAGGTGQTFDMTAIADISFNVPVILAGGLNPDNVVERIAALHPYAVDTSSGTESSPGTKDPELVRQFVSSAKQE